MRRFPFAALALIAGLTACGGDGATEPDTDPLEISYAPALEIDFSKMTRAASGLYYQDVPVGVGTRSPGR